MSVTYPHDRPMLHDDRLEPARDEPFVPVYARTRSARSRKGGLKTWMILAPIGVLVLGGAAAALMMGGGEEPAATVLEPAATAPVLPATPIPSETALIEVAPIDAAPVEAAPTPVARRQTTPAPARRAAPVRETAPTVAASTRVSTLPAEAATEPQPYTAELNTAPTPAAQPPVIVIQPGD